MRPDRVIYYQGEPGAFSEAAILGHWPAALPSGLPTFDRVVDQLNQDPEAVALLPIENAYRGPVYDVLDLLSRAETLTIRAEVLQPVELALIGLPGQRIDDVRTVRSHPQALMQSRGFWQPRGWQMEVALDTAGSARELKEFRWPGVAAIASPRAAEIYGLPILAHGIQDHSDNRTRFWLVSARPVTLGDLAETGYKMSVVFDLPEAPGSLYRVLEVFSHRYGLNLTKIESRPRPGVPFAFRFWLDIEGTAEILVRAMDDARARMDWYRILGQYPVVRA